MSSLQETDLDKIVLSYLSKRGYRNAEQALKSEARVVEKLEDFAVNQALDLNSSALNQIMLYNSYGGGIVVNGTQASHFEDAYVQLRAWVEQSLDLYKAELVNVCFPVFVHCYLEMVSRGFQREAMEFMKKHKQEHEALHFSEIRHLEGLATAAILKEDDLAQQYLKHKVDVRLSSYSFELLISFIQASNLTLILRIVNQRLNIKISAIDPSFLEMERGAVMTGADHADAVSSLNQRKIHWGQLNDVENPFTKKLSTLLEEDKEKEEEGKRKRPRKEEEVGDSVIKSAIALPRLNDATTVEIFEDVRNRVVLSAQDLPSVAFYTFLNTHQSLNAIEISNDASLVAGAFADSSVKIWDLKNPRPIASDTGPDYDEGNTYIHLSGHGGPVYAASFSPDRQFCITASEDCSARLWSLETQSNLVVYKGHNFPVWDVKFSPLGYYFATASHDRTARLWSTDHIYPLRIFAGHLGDVDVVQFHPNCNYVATGSADKTVRLWDIQSGECVRVFSGHVGTIYALAISPDGKTLASSGEDKKVVLWDLAEGRAIKLLHGHTKTVWSLDFSMDGSILASGSADHSVCLWDVKRARNMTVSTDDASTSGSTASATTTKRSPELLKMLRTKNTPVTTTKFTTRNLLLAAGPFGC
eukprot:GILK01003808.1.p1 GENE.GILK01003808.1~~GILK01003808.1.p1  ORF type:complete len:643 (+),score=125.74 GILK01003808.1:73-2001(+)